MSDEDPVDVPQRVGHVLAELLASSARWLRGELAADAVRQSYQALNPQRLHLLDLRGRPRSAGPTPRFAFREYATIADPPGWRERTSRPKTL
jgi:hypothetical protein